MPSEVKRATRVAEGMREALSALLARRVRDPRVRGVIVSRVVVTDDLRNAKVYVRLLGVEDAGDEDARRKELLTGLKSAAGMLRTSVTKQLSLRFAPELRFYFDEGVEKQARIDELLREIHAEAKDGGDD